VYTAFLELPQLPNPSVQRDLAISKALNWLHHNDQELRARLPAMAPLPDCITSAVRESSGSQISSLEMQVDSVQEDQGRNEQDMELECERDMFIDSTVNTSTAQMNEPRLSETSQDVQMSDTTTPADNRSSEIGSTGNHLDVLSNLAIQFQSMADTMAATMRTELKRVHEDLKQHHQETVAKQEGFNSEMRERLNLVERNISQLRKSDEMGDEVMIGGEGEIGEQTNEGHSGIDKRFKELEVGLLAKIEERNKALEENLLKVQQSVESFNRPVGKSSSDTNASDQSQAQPEQTANIGTGANAIQLGQRNKVQLSPSQEQSVCETLSAVRVTTDATKEDIADAIRCFMVPPKRRSIRTQLTPTHIELEIAEPELPMARFASETAFSCRLVHLFGSFDKPTRELKKLLARLGFSLREMRIGRRIGKSLLELLVQEEYYPRFTALANLYKSIFQVLEEMDPIADPKLFRKSVPSQQETWETFEKSLLGVVEQTPVNFVRDFYLDLLQSQRKTWAENTPQPLEDVAMTESVELPAVSATDNPTTSTLPASPSLTPPDNERSAEHESDMHSKLRRRQEIEDSISFRNSNSVLEGRQPTDRFSQPEVRSSKLAKTSHIATPDAPPPDDPGAQ
jgi:hypothetical protein